LELPERFANIITTAIFDSGILDCEGISAFTHKASDYWAEYLAYRTLTPAPRKSQRMRTMLLVAQHICLYRYASADGPLDTAGVVTDDEIGECVLELCNMMTLSHNNKKTYLAAASVDVTEEQVDQSSLDFRRHLLSAAAWMGEKSLVVKLVGEGCNWLGGP
jgi:hypothetical protein